MRRIIVAVAPALFAVAWQNREEILRWWNQRQSPSNPGGASS
jgi:hypothetical protein